MSDTRYLLEIVLRAKDEASAKIAALRNEVNRLKAEAEGKNALGDLDQGLKDVADDSEKAERASKRLEQEHRRSASSASRAGRAHRSMAEDVQRSAEEMRHAGSDADSLDERLRKLQRRFEGVRHGVESNTLGFRDARIQTQELSKEVDRLADRYDTASDAATRARKAAEEMRSFGQHIERSHATSGRGGSADVERRISDLARVTEQFEAHLKTRGVGTSERTHASMVASKATSEPASLASSLPLKPGETVSQYKERLAQIREGATGASKGAVPTSMGVMPMAPEQASRSFRALGRQHESLARELGPSHPQYASLMAESSRLTVLGLSHSVTGKDEAQLGALAKRAQEAHTSYQAFDKTVKSGALTEEETRRGYQDFARALNLVAHSFGAGTKEARDFGMMAERAAKKAKEAGALATGGFISSIKRGDVGSSLEWLNKKIDKNLMPRITGVSSFLRGLKDVGMIAFIQPLATGLTSLAGSMVAVGSAAAEAAAGIGGVFLAGLSQTVPMISVAVASLMRFKDIFQAVSLAGEREKEEYFEPHADQIKSLQLENQMITAHQQLVNSNIALLDAQERVKLSQIDLTEARVEAVRKIMQLTIAEKDARLQAEGADISLTESRRQLQIAIERGNVASLPSAELQVSEAELQRTKAFKEIPYVEREARLARERGVHGAPSVIGAREGLRASKEAVIQSRQAIAEAQRELRILQLQSESPASHETSTQAQIQFLKSRMSPAAKELTNTLTSIFASLRQPNSPLAKITDYFIAPFTEMAKRTKSLLGNNKFLGTMDSLAEAMGKSLKTYGKFFFGHKGTSIFETLAKDATENLPVVTRAITRLLELISIIARAAQPAFKKLSEDWSHFWGALDQHYGSKSGFTSLEHFFDQAATYAENFAHLAHAVIGLFIAIAKDAAPQGMKTVTSFSQTIEGATKWVQTHGPEVTKFFREAREGLSVIGEIAFTLGKALLEIFSLGSLRAFADLLKQMIIPGARDLINLLGLLVRYFTEFFDLFGGPGRIALEVMGGFVAAAIGVAKIYSPIVKATRAMKALFAATKALLAMEGVSKAWSDAKAAFAGTATAAEKDAGTVSAAGTQVAAGETEIAAGETEVATAGAGMGAALAPLAGAAAALGAAYGAVKGLEALHVFNSSSYQKPGNRIPSVPGVPAHSQEEVERDLLEGHTQKTNPFEGPLNPLATGAGGEGEAVLKKIHHEEYLSFLSEGSRKANSFVEQLEKNFGKMMGATGPLLPKLNEIVQSNMASIQKTLGDHSEKGVSALRKNFENAVAWIHHLMHVGKVKAQEGTKASEEDLKDTLRKMGISPVHLVHSVKHGLGGMASKVQHAFHNFLGGSKEAASGAYIRAQAGGVFHVAEGGHDEVVLSTDPRRAASQRKILAQYLQKAPHVLGSYAGGGLLERIPLIGVRGGGMLGAIVQSALGLDTAAADQVLARYASFSTPTGSDSLLPVGYISPGTGTVVAQIGRVLMAHGLNRIGASGPIGNALQESGWNPGAVGDGGGGLWGFTASPQSLADLQSFAASEHRPWTDVGVQTQFLLDHVSAGDITALNRASSPAAAARWFMENWERPLVATENAPRREQGAIQAYRMGYAVGGLIGDHLRRMGIRHLRKKIMKFAMGGKAPWGGEPVPIIAHAGERIMNPSQYAEASRPWGGERALDHHLGFDRSTPRQSFATGGHVPRVVGRHSQRPSHERFHPRAIEHLLESLEELTPEELAGEKRLARILKAVGRAFRHIGASDTGFLGRIAKWVEDVVNAENGVFARMQQGLEAFRQLGEQQEQRAGVRRKHHHVIMSAGGPVAEARQHEVVLRGEYKRLVKEQALIHKALSDDTRKLIEEAQGRVTELEDLKKHAEHHHASHKELKKLSTELRKAQTHHDTLLVGRREALEHHRELSGQITTNLQERLHAEEERIQASMSRHSSAYQTTSSAQQTHLSKLQSLGQYGLIPALDKHIQKSAEHHMAYLQKELHKAQALHNPELVNQIKQEMDSLKQTINSATTERVSAAVQAVQQTYQTESAQLSSQQSQAQTLGQLGHLRQIDQTIVASAQKQIGALTERLHEAESIGDISLENQLKQEIAGLETTVVSTTAEMLQAAEQQLQREGAEASARISRTETAASVARKQGRYAESGSLSAQALQEKAAKLQHEEQVDRTLLAQAVLSGNEEQVASLTEALDKNSAEQEENTQAIKENVVATREMIVQALEKEGQFHKGVYSAALSGYETLGKITGAANVAAMKQAVEGEGSALGKERSGLEGILGEEGLGGVRGLNPTQLISFLNSSSGREAIEAVEAQMKGEGNIKALEAFRSNVQALEQNTDASLQNSQKLAELNGQLLQPQSWSTAAFKSFRTSFFTGMGGLLPEYASTLPTAIQENLSTMPQFKGPNAAPTVGTLNITHPVEVLDPQLAGEQFAHAVANSPALP